MDLLNKTFLAFLVGVFAINATLLGENVQIETPTQLIDAFYTHLLSSEPTAELPQIFSEPSTFASALEWPLSKGDKDNKESTKIVWEYFRENRGAFLFDGIDPVMTVKKAAIGYCFVGFPRDGLFFDGILCIELTAPLSKGGKEGVFKQIRFPIVKNSSVKGPRYFIDESMILINGVIFGPSKDFKRIGNLYDQLGIKK